MVPGLYIQNLVWNILKELIISHNKSILLNNFLCKNYIMTTLVFPVIKSDCKKYFFTFCFTYSLRIFHHKFFYNFSTRLAGTFFKMKSHLTHLLTLHKFFSLYGFLVVHIIFLVVFCMAELCDT